MGEPKHTPGPWFLVASHNGIVWTDSIAICHQGCSSEPSDVAHTTRGWGAGIAEANARLIASAPELYDALRRLLATIPFNSEGHESDCHCVIHEARAALAKARGETP